VMAEGSRKYLPKKHEKKQRERKVGKTNRTLHPEPTYVKS